MHSLATYPVRKSIFLPQKLRYILVIRPMH